MDWKFWRLLKEQACDLVLLDIMMPEMDGFQTLAKLKQEPAIARAARHHDFGAGRIAKRGPLHRDGRGRLPFQSPLIASCCAPASGRAWRRNGSATASVARTDELEQALRLLEQAQAQLAVQASQDALTGLANRRSVDSHLEFRSKRETPFSVIYIDLNGFKKINDTYGHQAGDDLLKQVGGRLRLGIPLDRHCGALGWR